jgi:hypothetical protein
MAVMAVLSQICNQPTLADVIKELVVFMSPLWFALFFGVLIGWAWKPRWANFSSEFLFDSKQSRACLNSLKLIQLPNCVSWIAESWSEKDETCSSEALVLTSGCSTSEQEGELSAMVNGSDLEHLNRLVDGNDGGPDWIQMMDRSTQTMTYNAWRRDPETGPPQYKSRTVYEDCSPEMMRDFFWDDEFRLKWEDMLIYSKTLEECPTTGTMIVQWVRKFPFFCSDREYIIGRRIWESGRTYYCVTKGVPYPSVPRRNKPRRVDLYYSSWQIRAVESKKGDGQLTACEVILFHHEDMGIPWEIAKLGVRQGMWGAVKKIDPGLRSYQKLRQSGDPLSRCAYMAQINTKVTANYLKFLESSAATTSTMVGESPTDKASDEKPVGRNVTKLVIAGGAIALACSLDRGLLTKAVIFGVARRFANIGKRL